MQRQQSNSPHRCCTMPHFPPAFIPGDFLSATKITYLTPDLPHQDVQRQRATLESSCPPAMTFTSSREGSSPHSLEMAGFCIYKALKVISQRNPNIPCILIFSQSTCTVADHFSQYTNICYCIFLLNGYCKLT